MSAEYSRRTEEKKKQQREKGIVHNRISIVISKQNSGTSKWCMGLNNRVIFAGRKIVLFKGTKRRKTKIKRQSLK